MFDATTKVLITVKLQDKFYGYDMLFIFNVTVAYPES